MVGLTHRRDKGKQIGGDHKHHGNYRLIGDEPEADCQQRQKGDDGVNRRNVTLPVSEAENDDAETQKPRGGSDPCRRTSTTSNLKCDKNDSQQPPQRPAVYVRTRRAAQDVTIIRNVRSKSEKHRDSADDFFHSLIIAAKSQRRAKGERLWM